MAWSWLPADLEPIERNIKPFLVGESDFRCRIFIANSRTYFLLFKFANSQVSMDLGQTTYQVQPRLNRDRPSAIYSHKIFQSHYHPLSLLHSSPTFISTCNLPTHLLPSSPHAWDVLKLEVMKAWFFPNVLHQVEVFNSKKKLYTKSQHNVITYVSLDYPHKGVLESWIKNTSCPCTRWE